MPRKSRKNVGLIGLGIIGSRAAAGLRAAGFHVFVWNRSPKPIPNFLGSPAEVAALCEIIQIFVADAQALFDIIEQMSEALTSRHLVICNATVGPEATIEAARLVTARGAAFLDAPFTGSKGAAEKRELVYYIGGDEASCLRARPVLEATSRAIVRIGEIGHAATIKVVTNMIAAVSTQTLAEALAIVTRAGLDPEVLGAALEHNACRSGTLEMKLPKMISGDYDPHFSLKHMFKDVQLGIHVANALDIEIPATTVTAGVMYGALNQGFAELDFSALYKVYESPPTHAAALPAGGSRLDALERKNAILPMRARPETDRKSEAPLLADVLSAPSMVKPPAVEAPSAKISTPHIVMNPAPPVAKPREPEVVPGAGAIIVESGKAESKADIALKVVGATLGAAAAEETLTRNAAVGPSEPTPAGGRVIEGTLVSEASSSPGESAGTSSSLKPAEKEVTGRPLNFVRRWFVSRGG